MSFDVHLVPLVSSDQGWDEAAVRRVVEAHGGEPESGRLRTSDGGADLYGDVAADSWLMLNHIEGNEMWSVIHEVAASGPYAVMPVGCPTFVATLDHGDAVPEELPRPRLVVADGAELQRAIVAGDDGALASQPAADAPGMMRAFLDRHGTSPEALTPSTAVLAMTSWYGLQRAVDADLESDGDMLLFQWGTYDWGTGPSFEYNLTRQFAIEDPAEIDPQIWQLLLTLHFPPSAGAGLGRGQRWCHRPDDLADFQHFVMASETTRRLATETVGRVEVEFESVD